MIPWDDLLAEEVDPLLKLAQRTSKLAAREGVSDPVPDALIYRTDCHLSIPLDLPARPVAKVIADQGAQIREHKRATP